MEVNFRHRLNNCAAQKVQSVNTKTETVFDVDRSKRRSAPTRVSTIRKNLAKFYVDIVIIRNF